MERLTQASRPNHSHNYYNLEVFDDQAKMLKPVTYPQARIRELLEQSRESYRKNL